MSIAGHLQTIALTLEDILSGINVELINKGSTAADTLTQVDEKIAAIPAGGGLQPLSPAASSGDIRSGKKAYASSGAVITGTIPSVSPPEAQLSSLNNDSTSNNVTMTVTQSSTGIVDAGTSTSYGTINSTNCPNLVQGNIKNGVKILGVTGTYSGGGSVGGDAEDTDIRLNKTAYVNGSLVTGVLPDVTVPTPTISVSGNGYVLASVTQTGGITSGGTKNEVHQLSYSDDANFTPGNIKNGVTIFGVEGTYSGGGGGSGGDAVAGDIRYGKTAYVNGSLVTGNLQSISLPTPVIGVDGSTGVVSAAVAQMSSGIVTGSIYPVTSTYTLSSADDPDFVASNIKSGVTIFGVTGNYSGGGSSGFTGCELGSALSSGSITHSYDSSLNRDYLHISLSGLDGSKTVFGIYVVHSSSASSISTYVNSFIALKILTYWSVTYSTEGNTLPTTDVDVNSNVLNVSFRGEGLVLDGANYTAYPIYGTSY